MHASVGATCSWQARATARALKQHSLHPACPGFGSALEAPQGRRRRTFGRRQSSHLFSACLLTMHVRAQAAAAAPPALPAAAPALLALPAPGWCASASTVHGHCAGLCAVLAHLPCRTGTSNALVDTRSHHPVPRRTCAAVHGTSCCPAMQHTLHFLRRSVVPARMRSCASALQRTARCVSQVSTSRCRMSASPKT